MPNPTVIEVHGEAVGIVVPDGAHYRFVAVKFPVWSLDNRVFDSAESARIAASRAMKNATPPPQRPSALVREVA